MQGNDLRAEPWTWTPAPETPPRTRVVGALVLAASCIAIGFLVGRLSVGTLADKASRKAISAMMPASSPLPSATTNQPARDANPPAEGASSRPSLALKSDPEPAGKPALTATREAGPQSAAPPVVLLNPGIADPRRSSDASVPAVQDGRKVNKRIDETREADVRDNTSRIEATRQRRGDDGNGRIDRSARSGSEPDYQALRDYMLGR